jgi:tRNA 2-thiouridine synthesizing protein E
MSDARKVIDNPDTPSPRRADRELDLEQWDEEQGRRTAAELGIELTGDHWEVIRSLRDYYLRQGPPENGREIGDMLDNRFAEQGGRRYLHKLFPEGPVRQGMQIAGLPVPPHTEDEGFGTSR